MKLEDLHNEWAKDADFDKSQIDKAIRDIPFLHGKWWRIYTTEKQIQMAWKMKRDEMIHARREWYLGRMDTEEIKKRGWEHQHLRLVRQDVDVAMATDEFVRPLAANVEFADLTLAFITDCIKMINFRANQIKTWVEYLRWAKGED